MTIFELQRRSNSFKIRDEVVDIIKETSNEIVKLNQGQMFIGVLADSKPITNIKTGKTTYGYFWGQHRDGLGLQTEHFDLKVTGEFWNSLRVENVNSQTFDINSHSSKYNNLEDLFTSKILGLTKESKSEEYVPNYFFPALKFRIERKLGLKFG